MKLKMDEYQFPDLNEQERASVCQCLISAVIRDADLSEHETFDSWNYDRSGNPAKEDPDECNVFNDR